MLGSNKLIVPLGFFLALVAPIPSFGALDTISYQGQLSNEGELVDGAVSFKFAIVDVGGTEVTLWSNDSSSSGGGEPTSFLDLTVEGGVFQVQLGSVPMDPLPEDFLLDATSPILRVWIKGIDDPGFQVLGDQDLGASPFAFRAAVSDTSLTGGSGSGSSVWETDGANAYRVTGNVGIGTDSPEDKLHVAGNAKVEGSIEVADDNGLPIRFTRPGLDPWSITQTFSGSSGLALFKDSGEVGSFWGMYLAQNGRVGVQTDTPSGQFEIFGTTPPGTTDPTSDDSKWLVLRNNQTSEGSHKWGVVFDGGDDAYSPGAYLMANGDYNTNFATSLILGTRPDTPPNAPAEERLRIAPDGKIGIGVQNPQTLLHVAGEARADRMTIGTGTSSGLVSIDAGTGGGNLLSFHRDGFHQWAVFMTSSGYDGIGFYNSTESRFSLFMDEAGNVGVGANNLTPDATLDVAGDIRTEVITITGGADIAEGFGVRDARDVRPGEVLVIDEKRPGALRETTTPYDKRVAGIVSGAGNVATGLTLSDDGTEASGEFPLAMVGRVWCWCDADANGSIEPGDRLTTSATRGHAMRVSDDTLAPGSVIGKAMTELRSGTGLVLVLVNLQ